MSDANRTQIAVVEETTYGTTPSNPVFEIQRYTGSPGFGYLPASITSNEIQANRNVTDLILVGASAEGTINGELSFKARDTLLEGALYNDWVNKATRRNDLGATEITGVSTTTYTVLTGTAFAEGMLIKAEGFTNTGNNLVFRAAATTSATAIVTSGLTTEASPPTTAQIRCVGLQGASGDIAAALSPTRLTSSSLDFTTLGLTAGQWVKIGGSDAGDSFATAENNGWCRILSVAANSLVFDITPTGFDTDAGGSKTIMVFSGDYLRNGTTQKSYTIERQFQDHDPVTYELFTGMVVDTFGLGMDAQSILTANVGFQGKNSTLSNTRFSGATDYAAPTNDVFNTSSNVGTIRRGGSVIGSPNYVLSATVNLANNLRQRTAIGVLGSVGIGAGECNVSGTLQTYFGDKSIAEDVLNNTATSFDFTLKDNSNQAFVVDIPRMKFSSGAPDVTGKNTDVEISLDYQAYRHETLLYTIQCQRFYYVESA